MLGKDVRDLENGGIHPWTAEDDAESHLILYNHSNGQKKFDVAVWNGTMLWDKTYYVDASETLEISFNQLMRDKVKDDHKQVLDPAFNRGVVNWSTSNGGDATGRLMVTSRNAVMARNYSCGNFVIPCGGLFQEYSNFIGVGQAAVLFGLSVNYCNTYNPGQCYGNQQGGGSANFTSTTSAPSKIAFNGASQSSQQAPNMKGMAAGSSGLHEYAEANGCQTGGDGSATVQVPTSLKADTSSTTYSCTNMNPALKYTTNEALITYTVLDQNGTAIKTAGMPVAEVFTAISNSCAQVPNTPTATSGQTNTNGVFGPDQLAICSSSCLPANGSGQPTGACTLKVQQTWKANGYDVQTKTVTYTCQGPPTLQ